MRERERKRKMSRKRESDREGDREEDREREKSTKPGVFSVHAVEKNREGTGGKNP
jgi:hypothetical protein